MLSVISTEARYRPDPPGRFQTYLPTNAAKRPEPEGLKHE